MNKKVLIVIPLIVIMSTIFNSQILKSANTSSDSATYGSKVCIYKNNELVECTHNLITTYGLELIKSAVNGTVGNWNLTNLTLGGNTSAMQTSDTDLANIYSNNGLAPAIATYIRIGNGNSSLNYQWTASNSGTYNINSTGIYNVSNAGGHLFSEASFSNTQLSGPNGDKLNITYTWWIA